MMVSQTWRWRAAVLVMPAGKGQSYDVLVTTTAAALNIMNQDRFPVSALSQSLPERFEETVEACGDRLAVDDEKCVRSYRELNADANRLAHAILALDSASDLPVCLLLGQGATLITAILAVLKAGKIYVPLEPSDPLSELNAILAKAGSRLMISDNQNRKRASELCGTECRCLLADALDVEADQGNPAVTLSPDHNAYIYFTSGTTGEPKGVLDCHRNVLHNVMRYTNSLGIGRKDRLSLIQSSSFSGTVSTIFSGLLNGASVFPFDLRRQGVARLSDWIVRKRITVFHSVPLIFEQLLETGLRIPDIRLFRLEGDQMHPRHLKLFKQNFGEGCVLVNGLGTTETGLVRQFFIDARTEVEGEVIPIGYPVRDMEVLILREDGTEARPDEVGEIVVRSAYLARGYWQRPDLTAVKFAADPADPAKRWYRSGDLGVMRGDGCLDYLGRRDFQAKIRGRRVALAEIENALCELPGVRLALVRVDDKTVNSEQLVAYVVSDGDMNVSALRNALSAKLAAWLLPAHFVFLDALPADRHGKIARQHLPPRSSKRPLLAEPYRVPSSLLEEQLARCFGGVLRIDNVGANDDFFDLGGDSLLAAGLSVMIEEALEIQLSPDAVFEHRTVVALARHLGSHRPSTSVFPVRKSGARVPLFCVHVRSDLPASGFRRLSQLLGDDQPVYVLRDNPPMVRVEDMAAAFVKAMRSVQPQGPYRLCGNCLAGVFAYEMAQQLKASGDDVELLALIDTAFPPKSPDVGVRLEGYRRNWSSMIEIWAIKARLARLAEAVHGPYPRTWLDIRQALRIAEKRYRPLPYHGRTMLFVAGELDNQKGWQHLLGGDLKIVRIGNRLWSKGEERPHLIAEPLVNDLAAVLRGLL